MSIRDRIKDFRRVPAEELHANENNFRTHPAAQRRALEGVLGEVGIADALIAYESERYGGLTLIDGHLRLDVHRGAWPVLILDVTDDEADILLASLDPIAALAELDKEKLESLLSGLKVESEAVKAYLTDLLEDNGLLKQVREPGDGGDDFDCTPDEDGPTRSQPGDIWQLGDHLLAVGDSTDPDLLARLFGEEQFAVMFTDPPYGVSYDAAGSGRSSKEWRPIENDNLTGNSLFDFNRAFLSAAMAHALPNASLYIFAAGRMAHLLVLALEALHIHYAVPLVWVKEHFTLTWDRYHPQHEVILYAGEGAKATSATNSRWHGPTNETTVWEISRDPTSTYVHPTQKPIALATRGIENSSIEGEIIFDAFGGSGSTLIACERTHRLCRTVELDPRYADVILKRWEAESGLEAVCLLSAEVAA